MYAVVGRAKFVRFRNNSLCALSIAELERMKERIFFECSHPVAVYYLNNCKVSVKTQHII